GRTPAVAAPPSPPGTRSCWAAPASATNRGRSGNNVQPLPSRIWHSTVPGRARPSGHPKLSRLPHAFALMCPANLISGHLSLQEMIRACFWIIWDRKGLYRGLFYPIKSPRDRAGGREVASEDGADGAARQWAGRRRQAWRYVLG